MTQLPTSLIIVIVVISFVIMMTVRWNIKRRFLKGRKPANLGKIFQQSMVDSEVSYDIFQKVFNIVGEAYHIDPGLLRPSDKLKPLFDLDSYDFGEGTELLNDRLWTTFSISSFENEPKTIAELIFEIEKHLNLCGSCPEELKLYSSTPPYLNQ